MCVEDVADLWLALDLRDPPEQVLRDGQSRCPRALLDHLVQFFGHVPDLQRVSHTPSLVCAVHAQFGRNASAQALAGEFSCSLLCVALEHVSVARPWRAEASKPLAPKLTSVRPTSQRNSEPVADTQQ